MIRTTTRRLLPLLLLAILLFAGNILASRAKSATTSPVQDCPTACAQKRDATLTRCGRFSGDRKTSCENSARTEYDTCVQNCANGGRGIEGSGKP